MDSQASRLQELKTQQENPDFWNDQQKAAQVSQEITRISERQERHTMLKERLSDIETTCELLAEEQDEALLKEADKTLKAVSDEIAALEFEQMLSGPNDERDAILQINAGAGGTESCDWAEILLRMYRRYCERMGFESQVVDFTAGDQAGFRSVTMTVKGPHAFGYLKGENGVHRLVRISPFDASKRRHTSFSSVFVMPDIEDTVDIEVNPADLRIDTFRSSGSGGQHVNKTDSAVRLTHMPTGIVVACQSDRSQHRNRDTAMKLLKAKLYELEQEKHDSERQKIEESKQDIAWGSQIRSYVLHPYRMVKDHRTSHEVGNADAVLDGDLSEFIRLNLLQATQSP